MRELLPNVKVEKHQEANKHQEKEQRFIGSMKLRPGHTCWEIDLETLNVSPALFDSVDINFYDAERGDNVKRKKIVMQKGKVYINALNQKNALKRYMKLQKNG